MAKRVLLESQDLNSKAGTGIAAYVRDLAEALRASGYSASALFSSDVPLGGTDPVLRDIRLSDASYAASPTERALKGLRWAVGSPFGIRPVPVGATGAVVNPGREATFKAFDGSFASLNLFGQARRTLALYGRLAEVKLDEPPDLFHASRPVPIRVPNRPNIYTVHDIVPLRLPYASLDRKRFFYRQLKEVLRTADHIVSVSEFTKHDLCSFFGFDPKRVTTTYQTVSILPEVLDRSEDDLREELRAAYGLDVGEYYLNIGTLEPKKNIGRLVDAFSAARTRRPLVLVGGLGWLYEKDLASINDERFLTYRLSGERLAPERRVRRLDYLPRQRVSSLIRGARALLFPSIYEGFGLPVLEAMALGTPVITSNVSSLPEIAGDATLLVDPYDVDALTAAIDKLDADADLRAELKARGLVRAEFFSPERYRARVQSLYETVLG